MNKILLTAFLLFMCFGIDASEPKKGDDRIVHQWNTDVTQFKYPTWRGELNMSSSRIADKSYNLDDVNGYYLSDGALYTYIDGGEYENMFSAWDWQKIPGVTGYRTNDYKSIFSTTSHNASAFVGNVNNGETGISAMQIDRDGIRASKAWIITDRFVLCLGAGITSDKDVEVVTTVDQRLLRDDIKYLKSYRWVKTISNDFDNVPDIRFFQDKTGYIILNPQEGRAVEQQSPSPQQIFSLWLSHGHKPNNQDYEYLVLPATTQREVKNFDINQIKVLSNTSRLQSVKIDNITYIAAYPLADINVIEGVHFQSSNTGLFMIEEQADNYKVTVVDPTLLQTQMEVSMKGHKQMVQLPSGDEKGTPVVVYFDK